MTSKTVVSETNLLRRSWPLKRLGYAFFGQLIFFYKSQNLRGTLGQGSGQKSSWYLFFMNFTSLHERAVSLSKIFRQSESQLLGVLIAMQKADAFRQLQYPSLFVYCTEGLKLSEAQACYFSKVARKSEEVPALKEAIDKGTLSLSQARRVVAVITPDNSATWIEKAASLPQRELEREVTVANPKAVIREKIRPVAPERSELRVGISAELERKLQRVRQVLAQNKNRAVTLEDALNEMAEVFLRYKDPVEKAKHARAAKTMTNQKTPEFVQSPSSELPKPQCRPTSPLSSGRVKATVRHAVNQRDQGKCQALLPNGKKCHSPFWVEQHHIKPKSFGGPNTVMNLTTLCAQHHKMRHTPSLQNDLFAAEQMQR